MAPTVSGRFTEPKDEVHLAIVLEPIRTSARYRPRFGQGAKGAGLTLAQFQTLYQGDPFYSWFGLDNPLMYAAHKAAGGMTSIYRQIGIGCERLFRRVLIDALGLAPEDAIWSYDVILETGKIKTLHLDGRVPLDRITDPGRRSLYHAWMQASAERIGVDSAVFGTLTGTVFEVRQGYKSKDSKRQNADIANAATAYTKALLPCAVILSAQIDSDILLRYRMEKWAVVTGIEGIDDPLLSTYDFMRDIIGYDLAGFFKRNSAALRAELDRVLQTLLAPETMTAELRDVLRQRADYTHKYNTKTGRHGWLRLTPAYSLKIVEELISQYQFPLRIFDPFCGTATTALSAAYHGHEGVTTDINPFLVWLGNAKTGQYSPSDLAATLDSCKRAIRQVRQHVAEPVAAPPIHNIERWWSAPALLFLRQLRGAIERVSAPQSPEWTLLLVAFCRTLIELSNAAFNHQSMSFKDNGQLPMDLGLDMLEVFEQDVHFVLSGAADNPSGTGRVVLGDSRSPSTVVDGPFDRVITSPPYANRMSYIRELRPYMYWLDFLVNGRDAGELDWVAIGGTWGIVTSRLTEWERNGRRFASQRLDAVHERIADDANRSGHVLGNYVAKYVDDMWTHFQGLLPVLASGAELHYIVGNSTFYDVLLPVEQLYAEMLADLGFESIECRAIRKRNSKKELIEFDVTAIWPGYRELA